MNKGNASKHSDLKCPQQSVVYVGVRNKFINDHEFILREHTLYWIRVEAAKLESDIIISRSNFGLIEDKHLLQ